MVLQILSEIENSNNINSKITGGNFPLEQDKVQYQFFLWILLILKFPKTNIN